MESVLEESVDNSSVSIDEEQSRGQPGEVDVQINLPDDILYNLAFDLDSKSTAAIMSTCRQLHGFFVTAVMPNWGRRLQTRFLVPECITNTLQSPHLVYRRLEIIAKTGGVENRNLLKEIRYGYLSVSNDEIEAAWLLYPYIPESQKKFENRFKLADVYIKQTLLNNGARVGNFALVQYLVEEHHLILQKITLVNAALSGNLRLVKYLCSKPGVTPKKKTLDAAAESGNQELVDYLLIQYKNIKPDDNTLCAAALSGSVELVDCLVTKFAELSPNQVTLDAAALSGNLMLVKYLLSEPHCLTLDSDTLENAFLSGSCRLVRYLITKQGVIPDEKMLSDAIESGNLKLVRYLTTEHGVTPNENMLNGAAESGNLELMKVLVTECHLSLDPFTTYYAAKSGNLELLVYCLPEENEAEGQLRLIDYVAAFGNQVHMKHLIKKYCLKPDGRSLQAALDNSNLVMVWYLVTEQGLKIDPSMREALILKGFGQSRAHARLLDIIDECQSVPEMESETFQPASSKQ